MANKLFKKISDIRAHLGFIVELVRTTPWYPLIILLSLLGGVLSFVGIPMLILVLEYLLKTDTEMGHHHLISMVDGIFNFLHIEPSFYPVLITAALFILAGQILVFLPQLLAKYATNKLYNSYTKAIFESYQKVNWLWLTGANSGELNYVILREAVNAAAAHLQAQRLIVSSIQCIIFIVLAVQLSFKAVLLIMVFNIVLLCINYKNALSVRKLNETYLVLLKKIASGFNGFQQNKKFFKTTLVHSLFVKKLFSIVNAIEKNLNKTGSHTLGQGAWSQLFGIVVVFLLILIHQYLDLTYSRLFVLLLVFNRLSPHINLFSMSYTALNNEIPMYMSMKKRLSEMKHEEERNGSEKIDTHAPITFNDVAFAYPKANQVFKTLNLTIPARKTIALVGSSGVGKTTVLDLLLGLLRPDAGSIMYGTVPHDQVDYTSLRSKVAYVSQDPTLLDATLRENLVIGCPDAAEERIREICTKVHIADLIDALPNKLDTAIGENGIRLSGGQKQRVVLGRSLFLNPDILILDEATSELDRESEIKIQEAIEDLKTELTIIIVAHRLSTVKNADVIYVLEGGQVCESGTYSELLEKKGKLYYLDSLQK